MAVHCGVCGTRLHAATENFGGFPSSPSFTGWNHDERARRAVIADTCEECHARLVEAIVEVANQIVAANQAAVDQQRAEIVAWREQEKKHVRAREEFEREWPKFERDWVAKKRSG